MNTKLSIIILSYNTEKLLNKTLLSIEKANKENIHLQTIVVDNNSKDSSADMVQRDYPWAELIKSKKNLGYAGGNNLGIKRSHGNYILFLNSDVEIEKNALIDVLNFIRSDNAIGAVTPKVELFSGGMDPDCHRGFPTPWASITYFLGLETMFPKSKLFGQYHLGFKDMSKGHEIDAGFGTFMLIRREIIDKVGMWDDNYFFYGEDLDYFYRIKKAGWKVMFYPKVLALHHKGASSGLRKESKNIVKVEKSTKIATAKASIAAWEIFYKKFYKGKYGFFTTMIIIFGIKIKGIFRLIKFYLS